MAEAALASVTCGEFFSGLPDAAEYGGDDHLGDAIASFDDHGLGALVDEQDFDFAPVV